VARTGSNIRGFLESTNSGATWQTRTVPSATLTATPTATPTRAIVAITAPANGGTVSGTVTIDVAAEQPPVSWVNLFIDGNYIASSPPLTFSWNSTTVADGSHTIMVQGKNTSGTVVGTLSITVTVSN
jgi:hypothetical protein